MTRVGQRAMFEALALVLGIVGSFWILERQVRLAEVELVTWMAMRVPAPADLFVAGTSILVIPRPGVFFRAILAPSCSSLAAVLAMAVLVPLGRPVALRRRIAAVVTASAVIILGNSLRIAGALLYGRYQGRSGLVLFHDLVGGTFTFFYVIAGFLVGLAILLPGRTELASDD